MNNFPKYIALCGYPQSGKDEVAKQLAGLLGNARVIDDGEPLRLAAPHLFGFDPSLPFTQEGKATEVETPAGPKTVRYILGELGKYVESHYSHEFMVWRALMETQRPENIPFEHFIFPSVRRSSASAFSGTDHIVIEIKRPGYDSSPHDFDWYDPEFVTHQIHNTGTIQDLYDQVKELIEVVSQ